MVNDETKDFDRVDWMDYIGSNKGPETLEELLKESTGATVEEIKETIKNTKPRMDLIPPEVLFALGEILSHGDEKHGERDWEENPSTWGKHFAALQRHLWAWWGREPCDPDTGKSHLNNALARISFLTALESRGLGEDTRPSQNKL